VATTMTATQHSPKKDTLLPGGRPYAADGSKLANDVHVLCQ
jgi:hypothetical protein